MTEKISFPPFPSLSSSAQRRVQVTFWQAGHKGMYDILTNCTVSKGYVHYYLHVKTNAADWTYVSYIYIMHIMCILCIHYVNCKTCQFPAASSSPSDKQDFRGYSIYYSLWTEPWKPGLKFNLCICNDNSYVHYVHCKTCRTLSSSAQRTIL